MKCRDLIKLIESDGRSHHNTVGSYQQYKHPTKVGRVTIAGNRAEMYQKARERVFCGGRFGLAHARLSSHLRTSYEQAADGGWGAYAPDLPGLGVVCDSIEETEELIRDRIAIHLAGLAEDGLPIPEPTTRAERVAIPA